KPHRGGRALRHPRPRLPDCSRYGHALAHGGGYVRRASHGFGPM
ncbi:uncharacterized protein METZ01_LOCUS137401, partial [marine metagenome]